MTLYLGIDIGITGAIAVLDDAGALISIDDMPCLKDGPAGRRAINAPLLAAVIFKNHAHEAFVEHVSARPGEGPTGAFAFGRARGVIEGVLAACGLPCTFLTPPC
jgi:crossover junction endodeoxyribonuclease RuvC